MASYGLIVVATLALGLASTPGIVSAESGTTLRAFADEQEFLQLLAKWKAQNEEDRRQRQMALPALVPPTVYDSPAPPTTLDSTSLDRIEVTGSRISPADVASITNVQTVGVDEGDIVKVSGDHMVVLRRGRLFTVRIGDDRLQPISMINAYAPDADPAQTWYDEMLVSESTVIVIGYSYDRGGTEIGLFDIDTDGVLRYRATYQMRSNDYYSARNYASRLIGRTLIFYVPLEVYTYDPDPDDFMPAVRRWYRGSLPADFKRILPATRIYMTPGELDIDEGVVLHTVSLCDLKARGMQCRSTAVLGPEGRVFYVSQGAVYVWTTPWSPSPEKSNASALFRLPLDGTAPSALRTSGSPVDQMSFLERDGYLNVLVGSEADGEGMWASNARAGELALLRVSLDRLGDGAEAAVQTDYTPLPSIDLNAYDVQNRFIGSWLLYGAGDAWPRQDARRLPAYAVRYEQPGQAEVIRVGHNVERIDALGNDAILVGSVGADLHFTSLRLDEAAVPVTGYVQHDAAQGDDRTHGFFYRPIDTNEGIVGLPVLHFDGEGTSDRAGVLYLHNRGLRLRGMGTLDSSPHFNADDGCKASCVDWYGNARPIFMGDRIFALMGYELVEGKRVGDRIVERRRADFSPVVP
jgi:hypothetical protein